MGVSSGLYNLSELSPIESPGLPAGAFLFYICTSLNQMIMTVLLENEPDILAKAIMLEIMLDNGAINAGEPDQPSRYPAKHVAAIGSAAKAFFDAYPDLLSDKAIYDLATGEIDGDDTFAGFGSIKGVSQDETRLDTSSNPLWMALHGALDDYFNDGL